VNDRSAQFVAAALAFLLIALVGATIFILLSKPGGPNPTPTATAPTFGPTLAPTSSFSPAPTLTFSTPTPSAAPTATLLPTPTLLPTETPTGTPSPTPTISPTPSPTPTASPTPSPSPTPPPAGDNQHHVTLVDIGLDQQADPSGVQRKVTFGVDGPSVITATVKFVNAGKVRLCLVRDEPIVKKCIVVHGGTLSMPVYDSGPSQWSATLFGVSGVAGQYASLDLDFNAVTPSLSLDSFRFNGTDDPHYNGFQVVFQTTADGNFHLHDVDFAGAQNSYQWHLRVALDDVAVCDPSGGPSSSVDQSCPVAGGTVYSATFEEPEPVAGGGALPALVDATFSWP
jgi:hypothetical protein